MDRRTLIIIGCAVGCGILAALLVNVYITKQEREMKRGMTLVPVIAATKDIPAGTQLTADMIAKRKVPEKYVHGSAVDPQDANLVMGQVLNFPLKRADTILYSDLKGESDRLRFRGLAGVITEGERALSIPVDQVAGVSGLLKPSDHIDILCTIRSEQSGEEATITLLQNITILATGNLLAGEKSRLSSYPTLTVLVTLEEAELLVFAQKKGKLVAILRHPEDIETQKDIPKVTFSDIMKNEYRNKIQIKRDNIEVIKGGK